MFLDNLPYAFLGDFHISQKQTNKMTNLLTIDFSTKVSFISPLFDYSSSGLLKFHIHSSYNI